MVKSSQRLVALFTMVVSVFAICQGTLVLAGTTGTINGKVTDEQNKPIADVNVSAVSPSYTTKTTTGSNGFYAFTGLPVDTYTLTFVEEGYLTQTVAGITVSQDQTYVQNVTLPHEVKTIGKIPVRGTTSLVQPTQTVNQYTVNENTIQAIEGTPQDISEVSLLNALPGVTTDSNGYPIIRGGAENDEGFELEGIDATEPVTGQFINSLALNGVARLQLSTGGYDVSEGNTNSGVVNVVAKRGTYPGEGEATSRVGWPAFDHRLAFDYGNATPDNRFSYYFSFNGDRTAYSYGDGTTWYPFLNNATSFNSGNDNVLNLFYHWGATSQNELQYYTDFGANLFNNGYNINSAITPYATNNTIVGLFGGLGSGLFTNPAASLIDYAPLFPTQVGLAQNSNYPDHEDENHQIQKLNLKHQFTASSYIEARVFRTQSNVNFLFPWDGGAFADEYEFAGSDNRGIAADYSNQFSSQHELSFGGETIFTKPNFSLAIPSTTLFTDPLECGLSCEALGLTGFANPNMPGVSPVNPIFNNGASYVGRLNNQIAAFMGLPADVAGPLFELPDNASHVYDDYHRSNLWLKDRWQPNNNWTLEYGVRWDEADLALPSDTAQQNLFYFHTGNCNVFVGPTNTCEFFDQPGVAVGSDVTRPSFVSPRLALTYQINPKNVLRASYGRFIEFTPISNIENTYNIDPAAADCTIANGCFTELPGYNSTCVNGTVTGMVDHGARCNGIGNLYQQIVEDLNTNNFAQYTPVKPQLATSADFSIEHDFGNGLEIKVTPYYRKGTDYVVESSPLLFVLSNGQSVFGSPRESNAGINYNTGIEFSLDRDVTYGLSGFIHATYDNTLANYDSDFFPSVNPAAVAANHFFHVSYVSPVTATGNLSLNTRQGFHIYANVPFASGYRYGVGTETFVFINGVPTQVLNTDLAQSDLGRNPIVNAYYFTDPTNPGTILHPNIVASRGTPEGPDPGSLFGPAIAYLNLTVAHDIGTGVHHLQLGLRADNIFGNYSINTPGINGLWSPNGIGSYGFGSGDQEPIFFENEPYQANLGPYAYENEPVGTPRTYVVYLNGKF
jgi:Carboxypeptidase regulatory-like domain/TonB dependent receptor